jgi:hypothetical protein
MLNKSYFEYIEKHKSRPDPVKETLTVTMRDTSHNLDLTNSAHLELYNKHKLEYIALFEGKSSRAYDDEAESSEYKYAYQIFAIPGKEPNGKITVGYGFNMDAQGARNEWRKVFEDKVSFDDVRNGKAELTDEQMKKLLLHSVDIREKELQGLYGEIWYKLRANERIAVLSAYYNGPKLVNTSTKFFGHLKRYIETNDPKYLKAAVSEHGNNKADPKLVYRRQLESNLLDSTKAPFYRKPNEDPLPPQPLKVVYNETRVPIGLEQLFPHVQDSEFVIWRTRLDDKVRDEHLEREGKVYHISEIAGLEDYGCRCSQVPVTGNLLIVDQTDKIVSLYSWIRYGGGTAFEVIPNHF